MKTPINTDKINNQIFIYENSHINSEIITFK